MREVSYLIFELKLQQLEYVGLYTTVKCMGRCSGVGQADDQRSSCSAMSKPGDVRGRFPEAYHISKYNGTGTESNRDRKWKYIK